SLTVTVHHFERDLLNIQRLQCPCSIPCRYRRNLKLGAVSLRQHEPIPTEYEPLKRDFGFVLVTSCAIFLHGSLTRDRYTQFECLLGSFNVSAKLFPAIE